MFRKKRTLLLLSVAVLFCLMIVDIWTSKAQPFERFGKPFVNERKTDARDASRRSRASPFHAPVSVSRASMR